MATGRERSLPLAELRSECRRLREHLLATGAVPAATLAELEPGGGENPDAGKLGVLKWYGLLNQRMALGRREVVDAERGAATARDEADAIAALVGREELVRLLSPVGEVTQVGVYPKSLDALLRINAVDALLDEVVTKRATLLRSMDPADRLLLQQVDDEMLYQLQRLVFWITHPEPGLPPDGVLPGWVQALDILDLHRLIRAHQVVNGLRLRALAGLTTPSDDPSAKRPSFAVFVAGVAAEQGIPPHQMLRHWSLAEVLAAARLAGQARKDAHEAGKAREERKRPVGRGRAA